MTGRSVLVVGEAVSGDLLRAKLEAKGLSVVLAQDGKQALALLSKFRPSLILTDVMMPVMDGLALLSELKARVRRPPPVIAMSAIEGYVTSALASGATAALQQPFDLSVVVEEVLAILGHDTVSPLALVPKNVRLLADYRRSQQISTFKLERSPVTAKQNAFAKFAAELFEVPMCLVSFVDREKEFWTAGCGMSSHGSRPLEKAFCTHVVRAMKPLIIQDAAENPAFRDHPAVQELGVRFYAGVPVTSRLGEPVGTLCLMDTVPRAFGHLELAVLSQLAKRICWELEWREKLLAPDSPDSTFRNLHYYDRELEVAGREAFTDLLPLLSAFFALRERPVDLLVGVDFHSPAEELARALQQTLPAAFIGRLGKRRFGLLNPAPAEPSSLVHAISHLFSDATILHCTRVPGAPAAALQALRRAEERFGDLGLADGQVFARAA